MAKPEHRWQSRSTDGKAGAQMAKPEHRWGQMGAVQMGTVKYGESGPDLPDGRALGLALRLVSGMHWPIVY